MAIFKIHNFHIHKMKKKILSFIHLFTNLFSVSCWFKQTFSIQKCYMAFGKVEPCCSPQRPLYFMRKICFEINFTLAGQCNKDIRGEFSKLSIISNFGPARSEQLAAPGRRYMFLTFLDNVCFIRMISCQHFRLIKWTQLHPNMYFFKK